MAGQVENHNLAINSARAIGCNVVNIGAADLVEGRHHLVSHTRASPGHAHSDAVGREGRHLLTSRSTEGSLAVVDVVWVSSSRAASPRLRCNLRLRLAASDDGLAKAAT